MTCYFWFFNHEFEFQDSICNGCHDLTMLSVNISDRISRFYMEKNFKIEFQDSICNGCYDLTVLSVNISDIAIMTIENVYYHCIIHNIIKSEAINLLENSVLENCVYI